ncbi:hypothetical protein [Streptomyces echinatus]|uniref:hypothetical protein n=1 Tax=Streptomyces echinatus TaxID=67293 RepID=UPI00380E822B
MTGEVCMTGAGPAALLWDLHDGQGPRHPAELGPALGLWSLIGWERAARQKSAGILGAVIDIEPTAATDDEQP